MMHDRRLPASRRIDPETGEVERAPARGRAEKREPSSKRIEHMRWDWFPLAVWSGREKLARLMLEDVGLTTFCPVEIRWRNRNKYDRARRAKRQIGYPVIPGLIFVGLPRPWPWHLVMAPHVVSHVISVDPGQPRRLAHHAVGKLLAEMDSGRWLPPDAQRWMLTGAEFAEGDTVRVISGVLHGQRFRVERIDGRMARLFGEWFGAEMGFDVPLDILAKDE